MLVEREDQKALKGASMTDSYSDVAHPAPGKAVALGAVYGVLAISMLALMVWMYFRLPVISPKLKNEPYWPLLLIGPLFFVYLFSVKATYWFQTAYRPDFFLRASSGGLCIRFPEERGWFLPGYNVAETVIPWKEIRNCFSILHVFFVIPVDICLVIAKANGEIVSISTCHFSEGRRQLVGDIVELWTRNQQTKAPQDNAQADKLGIKT